MGVSTCQSISLAFHPFRLISHGAVFSFHDAVRIVHYKTTWLMRVTEFGCSSSQIISDEFLDENITLDCNFEVSENHFFKKWFSHYTRLEKMISMFFVKIWSGGIWLMRRAISFHIIHAHPKSSFNLKPSIMCLLCAVTLEQYFMHMYKEQNLGFDLMDKLLAPENDVHDN